MSDPVPPAAAPETPSPQLEAEIRARIEKEIETRKADSKTSTAPAADPAKSATIEAELRTKLEEEISRRTAEGAAAKAATSADVATPKPEIGEGKNADGEKAAEPSGDVKPEDDKQKATGKLGGRAAGNRKPAPRKNGKQTSQPRAPMSDRDQRILEEKANIDASLKIRNRYIYAAITAFTLLGLAVLGMVAKRKSGSEPAAPSGTTVNQVEPAKKTTGAASAPTTARPVTSRAFKGVKAAANDLVKERKFQEAIDLLTAHAAEEPIDADACDAAIASIRDNYINMKALPPPDPKAQWSAAEQAAARERRLREQLLEAGGEAVEGLSGTVPKIKHRKPKTAPGEEGVGIPADLLIPPAVGGDGIDGLPAIPPAVDIPKAEEVVPGAVPAVPPPAVSPSPTEGLLQFDDSALKIEPPKAEKPAADPFGGLDELLEGGPKIE